MNDMRQKLLPVFLEEAGRKILLLNSFLAAVGGEGRSLDDLEAAFRAAHTLKGTAALVRAEAVRTLSARMEGLLEGHFEKAQFPSNVEYEAMQLALDRLQKMVSAIERDEVAPVALLKEAEIALNLAISMPGQSSLAALLAPGGNDPFADDPAVEHDDLKLGSVRSSRDPFAEDDAFELQEDVSANIVDPFAEDDAFETVDPFAEDPEIDRIEPLANSSVSIVGKAESDPFADDPDLQEVQSFTPDPAAMSFADIAEPADLSGGNDFADIHPVSKPVVIDEQVKISKQGDSFIERMRKRIEKESALETAVRLSETLLRQNEGEIVARNYKCCRFQVARKEYHLPIANMIEITDLPQIVRLPLAPAVVKGLINLRGQVLPVIDLGVQTEGSAPFVAVQKLVIAEANGEKLAFLTDGIPDLSEEIRGERVDVIYFVDKFRAGGS